MLKMILAEANRRVMQMMLDTVSAYGTIVPWCHPGLSYRTKLPLPFPPSLHIARRLRAGTPPLHTMRKFRDGISPLHVARRFRGGISPPHVARRFGGDIPPHAHHTKAP